MTRPISLVARGAAVLVVLLGLYASAQAADLARGDGRAFLVTFLFFGALATLLWIAADTIDAVDQLHQKVDGVQAELRSQRGQRLDPMNAALIDLGKTVRRLLPPDGGDGSEAPAPAAPTAGAAPSPRQPAAAPAASDGAVTTPAVVEECAIEQAGSVSRPEFRATISGPKGWYLLDYEPFFDGASDPGSGTDYAQARERALRALVDRLVANGWEQIPSDSPNGLPRFRRLAT